MGAREGCHDRQGATNRRERPARRCVRADRDGGRFPRALRSERLLPRSRGRAAFMNTRFRAAAYVRMSTDHQELSIQIQLEEIHTYAKARKFEVVRVFSDEGRSGVTAKGRPALQEMLQVVQSGEADF